MVLNSSSPRWLFGNMLNASRYRITSNLCKWSTSDDLSIGGNPYSSGTAPSGNVIEEVREWFCFLLVEIGFFFINGDTDSVFRRLRTTSRGGDDSATNSSLVWNDVSRFNLRPTLGSIRFNMEMFYGLWANQQEEKNWSGVWYNIQWLSS